MKYDIKSLKKLSTNELKVLWLKSFKSEAPEWLHRSYLIKYIAWHKKYGALDSQTQKKINNLVEKYEKTKDIAIGSKTQNSVTKIIPGTKLIREFRNEKHEVIMMEKGFEYNSNSNLYGNSFD